jgi:3-deoxy-D-manno-octulosonate 8-phosphate phosphatase (KDO 8-P phosphatase)
MTEERLRKVRAVVLDVDGVLTDGGMYYGLEGEELKKFNSRDGMGVRLLRDAGIEVAIITGENSQAVARRAEKLKIGEVHLGIEEKLPVLQDFASRKGLDASEIAYMGDDVNDLPCLGWVGLPASPSDAMPPVLSVAHLITERRGGEGAVRELADQILSSRS